MMQTKDTKVARLLKKRIQTIAPVRRMIVFGSRARGDATRESDLDVFIELSELTPTIRTEIYHIAWEVGFDNGLVIFPLLTSTPLLLNSLLSANPILNLIEKEGVAV
jgi:predicted nucleotidyltransferase